MSTLSFKLWSKLSLRKRRQFYDAGKTVLHCTLSLLIRSAVGADGTNKVYCDGPPRSQERSFAVIVAERR